MLKLLTDKALDENDLLSLGLDKIARLGAQKLLHQALELEVEEYLEKLEDKRDSSGKRLVVRHGKAKERQLTTGAGTITIKAPRVKDRRPGQKFTSQILPPYLRKTKNVESILPILYLKGPSTSEPWLWERLCVEPSKTPMLRHQWLIWEVSSHGF